MLDKNKMVNYLKNIVENCNVINTQSDRDIAWQCNKILNRIELGMFDKQEESHG